MGAVGSSKQTETYWDFKDNPLLSTYTPGYENQKATDYWREHDELSNAGEWEHNLLTKAESDAIENWVGSGFYDMSDLYHTQWDSMDDWQKEIAANMYNAISKFELKKGITVNRATDFKIFGGGAMTADDVKNFLNNETSNGVLQSDGFMSFSTRTDGVSVASHGLVIHMNVPANKGWGAYVSGVGGNPSEREYLTNNNSVIQFDSKSVTTDSKGNVHVNAKMLGTAKMQSFDPKNKSGYNSAKTIKEKKK